MKIASFRAGVPFLLLLLGALTALPDRAVAHPQLAQSAWKEIHGPWRLTFQAGNQNNGTWSGAWSGKLHHDGQDHPNGVYVLVMRSATVGTLTLYENNVLLCSGTVHFEGRHRLEFGTAEYHRE